MSAAPDKTDVRAAWLAQLAADLTARQQSSLKRTLRPLDSATEPEVTIEGRRYLQFCTNNYLGLATDPELIDASRDAAARWGTGSGASRLVAGSLAIHHELEAELARFKHAEAALLFPTGFMANLAAVTTFAGEGDLLVSDKLNHASLLDAARFSGAEHRTFPHRNHARAAALLDKPARQKFLVTDSVFSMDGDIANLPALCDVADTAGALIIIDEAHGTGVLGLTGGGVAELQQVEPRIALTVGTLSKALGSVGGFITGPRAAIDMLINAARSFIYTTALPASASAAALAALRIVQRDPARRQRVLALANHVRRELVAMGYDCGDSVTPIIPILIGDPGAALALSEQLKSRGLWVPAIRPPTVPPNSARLRLSLMATHTDTQIERLLSEMKSLRPTP